MIERISVSDYLKIKDNTPLVDVRSPGEFKKGHIPGAFSIPIFDNEERAIIGTIYKQNSKEAAINRGYDIVEPKLIEYTSQAKKIAPNKILAVHCWRGGMRSSSMGQHFLDNGFDKVYVIEGGYKAFRNFTFSFFEKDFKLLVLGGYTGSGKTEILQEIEILGEQVVDLEGMANHKGSAFGGIGQENQPSVEHFQNKLFMKMYNSDLSKDIWIEDESLHIGKVVLPKPLYEQIRSSRVFFVDIPIKERAKFLLTTYGQQHKEYLKESVYKIQKRLGPLNTKNAIEALENDDLLTVAEISLIYYDKAYLRGLDARDKDKISEVVLEEVDHIKNAVTLIRFVENL